MWVSPHTNNPSIQKAEAQGLLRAEGQLDFQSATDLREMSEEEEREERREGTNRSALSPTSGFPKGRLLMLDSHIWPWPVREHAFIAFLPLLLFSKAGKQNQTQQA